jgi:hypothetical protein
MTMSIATTDPRIPQLLALSLPEDNDAHAGTVRDYLIELLAELWREEAQFSSKAPFGNSGWQYDIYAPMISAGLAAGSLDEDGYVEDCDTREADGLIIAAIRSLTGPS